MEDYWKLLQQNVKLFHSEDVILETIRQWFILLASAILIPVLVIATIRLKKFTYSYTFDQLILVMETVKVSRKLLIFGQISIFVLTTFFIFTVTMYLVCLAIQSMARALICGAFLARVLVVTGRGRNAAM